MRRKPVFCAVCGICFDLYAAPNCDGHPARKEMAERTQAAQEGRFIGSYTREFCRRCPLGHALHDAPAWWLKPIRDPTEEER